MPKHGWAGVIQHHTGHMEHPANDVDGVFRAVESLVQLFRDAAAVLHLHVVPGVHINFLDARSEDVFGQE
ncbi:hypothetical protein SDC9_187679 [bioreactor metagenome]|uniref:Uncharacterized protein n=1 Tax=bioreactor metagenome TaxID=1076179 RepID=A0A645HXV3_9ZZZZ